MRRTGSKFGWVIVAACALLVIGMLVVTIIVLKSNPGQEASGKADEIVTGTETEEETETSAEEERIRIENLSAYFSSAAWYEYDFEECLGHYVQLKGLDATAGSMFYMYTPEEEPDSTQYYVQLNDPMQTIVILTWHENDETITSSKCSFTREDVINQCWNNVQPAEKDITPEEEAAFLGGESEAAAGEEGVTP